MQEEVAAPFIRLLALLVRRNAATIGGEAAWLLPGKLVSATRPLNSTQRSALQGEVDYGATLGFLSLLLAWQTT